MKLKSRKKYRKEFYANCLYNKIVKEDTKAQFVKTTKILIEEGKYTTAIRNLKILYYEKGLNMKVSNYYDEKIDVNKINVRFLENQKLLLEDFFGKYSGIMSMFYLNTLYAIAIPIFVSVITTILTLIMSNDYRSEVLKQYFYDKIVNNKTIFNYEYFNAVISDNIFDTITKMILPFLVIFIVVYILRKIILEKIEKEKFYKLCLQAVEELLNERNEIYNQL